MTPCGKKANSDAGSSIGQVKALCEVLTMACAAVPLSLLRSPRYSVEEGMDVLTNPSESKTSDLLA